MKKVTDEVVPMLNKLWERSQDWFSRFINAADHTMSKILQIIEEKKKQFDKYLVERRELLLEIEMRKVQLAELREQTRTLINEQSNQILSLYDKLSLQTNELINLQEEYLSLEKSVKDSSETIINLQNKKDEIENERNWLRSEYENLQKVLADNTSKLEKIYKELDRLKQEQLISKENNLLEVYQDIQNEIDKKNVELANLELENIKYIVQINEIETQLLMKAKEIANLAGELQRNEKNLQQKEQAIHQLRADLQEKKSKIKEQEKIYYKMKKEIEIKESENEQYIAFADAEIKNLEKQLIEQEEVYYQEQIALQEEMEKLNKELITNQTRLAIEKAENGEPYEVSAETMAVLEQEYETRYKTLYRNSVFHKEFFQDYYRLIPSDRLKIEAVIAQLNYDFDLHISKVRPNTVSTKKGKLLEYPFGSDNAGRLFLKRENGKINYFRISRTKNGKGKLDQQRVIAWLQKRL